MARKQAVIFDLDGTLLDTLNDLATAGNTVLAQKGLPTHSVEAYRTFIGDGMANLVRRIFPADCRPEEGPETEAVLVDFRAAYENCWKQTTVIFPGIAELLDQLCEDEIPIGVLSNKAHDFTIKCVDEFLSHWRWQAVFGARNGVPRKPDPAAAHEAAEKMGVLPEDCYFVGDSDVDIFTGVNAGMHAVGVSWGFRSIEELKGAGAEVVIERPSELLSFLEIR